MRDDIIDSVYDHEGNAYAVVQIGDQCWLKQNMRAETSPDGTNILKSSGSSTTAKMAYNVSGSATVDYGKLYNWCAALDNTTGTITSTGNIRGICPLGWHVPKDDEWATLTKYVYDCTDQTNKCADCAGEWSVETASCIAKSMASASGWKVDATVCNVGNDQTSNNATCFGALPAGYSNAGTNLQQGEYTYFWTAIVGQGVNNNGNPISNASHRYYLRYDQANVNRTVYDYKEYAYSVRCVRDEKPMLSADSAKDVSAKSAHLYGNLKNLGTYAVSAKGFCLSNDENFGIDNVYVTCANPNTIGSFNIDIAGLRINQTYYYRAYVVTTTKDTIFGGTQSFTTLSSPCGVTSVRTGTDLGNGKYADKDYADKISEGNYNLKQISDHEGNVYNVVPINGKCWMAENMRAVTNRHGERIVNPLNYPSTENKACFDYVGQSAAWINNDSATYAHYGVLYNWNAAVDTFKSGNARVSAKTLSSTSDYNDCWKCTFTGNRQGICPSGWHVPSSTEFGSLYGTNFSNAVKYVSGAWIVSNVANSPGDYANSNRNSTLFSALPAGYSHLAFSPCEQSAYFWTATNTTVNSNIGYGSAYMLYFVADKAQFNAGSSSSNNLKADGFSVRCVRDN